MEQIISWLVGLGVDPDWAPLIPVLVILAVIAVVEGSVFALLVRRGLVSRKSAAFWLFISPWAFGFLAFTLGPMLYSLYLSFTRWDVVTPPTWAGLSNYQEAFFDPLVYRALGVTFTYVILAVPLGVFLSFLVGLLMNRPIKGMPFIRTAWYLPSLVTGVAQATLMIALFRPEGGVINSVLAAVGIEGPGWLYSSAWAVPTVALMSLWTVGGTMVIYLAALQGIPRELYDAAAVDGAGPIRAAWTVTVPQMSPIILFNLLTGLIGALQIFTQGYVATGGAVSASALGPDNSLLFFVFYLYNVAFSTFRFGYASALAWLLFIIIMILTLLTFRFSRGLVYYEADMSTLRKRRRPVGADLVKGRTT